MIANCVCRTLVPLAVLVCGEADDALVQGGVELGPAKRGMAGETLADLPACKEQAKKQRVLAIRGDGQPLLEFVERLAGNRRRSKSQRESPAVRGES